MEQKVKKEKYCKNNSHFWQQKPSKLLKFIHRSTVRNLDPMNELTFLLIKSKNNEIMVASDKEFLLIVV